MHCIYTEKLVKDERMSEMRLVKDYMNNDALRHGLIDGIGKLK